jgi:hypothetical protein
MIPPRGLHELLYGCKFPNIHKRCRRLTAGCAYSICDLASQVDSKAGKDHGRSPVSECLS